MSDGFLVWTALAAVAALVTVQIVVLKWVASIARQNAKTESTAASAATLAGTAIAKAELLSSQFNDHRVYVAQAVTEIKAMASAAAAAIIQAETQLSQAMNNFGDRLDRITQRLDHILDARPQPGVKP